MRLSGVFPFDNCFNCVTMLCLKQRGVIVVNNVMKTEKDTDRKKRQILEDQEREIKEEMAQIYLQTHSVTDKEQKETVRLRLRGLVKDKNFLRDYEIIYENGKSGWEKGYTVYSNVHDGDIVWYTEGFKTNLKVVLLLDSVGEEKLFVEFFNKEAAELFDAIEDAYKKQEALKTTKEKNTIEIAIESFFQRIK